MLKRTHWVVVEILTNPNLIMISTFTVLTITHIAHKHMLIHVYCRNDKTDRNNIWTFPNLVLNSDSKKRSWLYCQFIYLVHWSHHLFIFLTIFYFFFWKFAIFLRKLSSIRNIAEETEWYRPMDNFALYYFSHFVSLLFAKLFPHVSCICFLFGVYWMWMLVTTKDACSLIFTIFI